MSKRKQRKIMTGDIAKIGLPFHIGGMAEHPSHIREINAEPTGKVNQRSRVGCISISELVFQQMLGEPSLVLGSEL